MTKQAERPLTASFIEGSSCTFDSNDFVEFDILTHDLPMGEIVFKGNPFTDAGLTELGRCVYDYCDHGLYVYQELANMLYEAQHPWLDYADAVEKGAFDNEKAQDVDCLCGFIMQEGLNCSAPIGSFVNNSVLHEAYELNQGFHNGFYVAFKPVKPFDFYHFNQVKVWQPLETVL
jgi:hypothetical protein